MNIPEYLHPRVSEILSTEMETRIKQDFWVVLLGLIPRRDGDQWYFLWGENLQDGVVGFGDTPVEAMGAFQIAMYEKIEMNKSKLSRADFLKLPIEKRREILEKQAESAKKYYANPDRPELTRDDIRELLCLRDEPLRSGIDRAIDKLRSLGVIITEPEKEGPR